MTITYQIILSSAYKKDVALAKRRGLDVSKLNEIVGLLATGQRLPPELRDHKLKGDHAGDRECHIDGIKGDWVLIYRKNERTVELRLIRTGYHRELGVGD